MRETKAISITPKPDCKTCDGNGMMRADRVPAPFGPGTVALPEEFCHCVVDQLPPEDEDCAPEDYEIFLKFPDPCNEMRFTWTYGPHSRNTIFINDNSLPNPKERGIAGINCHQIGNEFAERLAKAWCRSLEMLALLEGLLPMIEEEAERRASISRYGQASVYWAEMQDAVSEISREIALANGREPAEADDYAEPDEDEDEVDDYDYAADDRNFDADRERRYFGK